MGIQYSSDIRTIRTTEGILFLFYLVLQQTNKLIMKVFVIAAVCLAAAVSAEPEADAYYGYGYGHQLHWPGAAGPGFSATCWGCRPYGYGHYLGKRSADAEPAPYYGYGFYGHPYGYYGYGLAHPRAVIPTAAGPTGVAGHPGAATSYVTHGVPLGARGKRSAEPYYGYYGHPFAYRGFGYGVAGHPGAATSFVQNSPWGLGK